jgi:hypothetical protein
MSNQCSILPTSPVEDSKVVEAAGRLVEAARVNGHMDESDQIDLDKARLINELLAHLGMLMEDASTPALLRDFCGGNLAERIRVIDAHIARMKSISNAAMALLNG